MAMFKVIADDDGNLHGLPIDFAGPDPLDNSVKLNMAQAEELLLDSVKSDVQTFMQHWKGQQELCKQTDPANYPAELTAERWYQEFYAWMGV